MTVLSKIKKRQEVSVLYLRAGQRAGVTARAGVAFRCGAAVRVTICTLFTGIPEEKCTIKPPVDTAQ